MNRRLEYFNLLGVATLAVLCVFQWRSNRELNLGVASLEKTSLEQAARAAEQADAILSCAADLDSFRDQLVKANIALNETRLMAGANERELHQMEAQRDQLKAAVTNWSEAVAARDEQLKVANEQLQTLANGRNEAVTRFNELAERYNAAVRELNEVRTKAAASVTNTAGTSSPAR